jgi:hypothetical protein
LCSALARACLLGLPVENIHKLAQKAKKRLREEIGAMPQDVPGTTASSSRAIAACVNLIPDGTRTE